MKIQAYIERDGGILLAFLDEIGLDKSISVWTLRESHAQASRAYLRSLRKPATETEVKQAWRALRSYCNRYRPAFED